MTVTGAHDHALVALSVLIAIVASYAALDLAGRARVAGRGRAGWLAAAALAMGGGIWSMHFVAMLAFALPGMAAGYDIPLTALSLVAPVVLTGFAFFLVAGRTSDRRVVAVSGVLMGGGIVVMHYLGMAALEVPARLGYMLGWVAASVVIAIGASMVALRLAFARNETRWRPLAAIAMGAAIAGMHYAAMAGAVFTPLEAVTVAADSVAHQARLAAAIAAITFAILFLSLTAAVFDRRLTLLAEREAAALRHSEELLRALYRRTPLPLFSLDAEGRLEKTSDGFVRLLKHPRESLIGRPIGSLMEEASAERFIRECWPTLIEGRHLADEPFTFLTAAHEPVETLMSANLERLPGTGEAHVLGGLVDVTGRRRTEEELRQSQKVEVIGQLTGGVAHDFNNLLAVILSNLELLQNALPPDPAAERLAATAVAAVERGAALTQRMLAFARRQDLMPAAVDVAALSAGLHDLLQRSIGPMIRIETRFPPDLPPAHVDANQLELALVNLAVNARDAMPEGGRIVIAGRLETVAAGGELAPGRYVVLALSDTGTGMDADTLARATEPFFTTKGIGKGTGLGLSMVHGLAAQSGGRLDIVSRPGEGTTVEIWLPVAEEAVAEPTAARPAGPARAPDRPLSVLAVDDDPLVLMGTVAMLEDLGHRVVEAASGAEALARLDQGELVDLLVTDQAMPGMTGLDLVRAARLRRPDLPAILSTGYAELPSVPDPSIHRLTKPFGRSGLAAAIAEAMREIA